MSLTVIVARNAPARVHGFLRSSMVEIAAGVYVSVFLTKRAREQIWEELLPFGDGECSLVMVAEDSANPQRCCTWCSGTPRRDLLVLDGMLISGKRH